MPKVQGRPQKTQNIIILESHVICCTLSTSGGFLLESAFRAQGGVPFSCVIVDEVSKPLQLCCKAEMSRWAVAIECCQSGLCVFDSSLMECVCLKLKWAVNDSPQLQLLLQNWGYSLKEACWFLPRFLPRVTYLASAQNVSVNLSKHLNITLDIPEPQCF